VKRLVLLFVVLGTAMVTAVLVLSGDGVLRENQLAEAQTAERPNFVFILSDDMRKDDLKYMPKTRSLLGAQGMQFEKAFVSLPVCCPSWATIMRGQYAHNTGVGLTVTTAIPMGGGKAT
jgi:arylsulfatase A-like enzyme